jgi:hypothetical protein
LLIAALLFAVGMAEGWHYRAGALMVSSTLVLLAWLALWGFLWTASDIVKVLLLLANLAAHQAGYLVGAYLGAETGRDP